MGRLTQNQPPRAVVGRLWHHLRHLAAGLLTLTACFRADTAVFHVRSVLFALGSASGAGISAEGAHLAVERRFVTHESDACLTGRSAVETGFEARLHALLTNAVRGAHFALRETIQTVGDASLHLRGSRM